MSAKLISNALRPIYDKVVAAERVTDAEALALYASNDLNSLGTIANVLRERKNGNVATYIRNQYINYSNVCLLSCQFCAFGAKKRDAHAFELGIDEIVEKVRQGLSQGVTEVHMVGGLHPTLKGEWYLDLLRGLRALDPQLFIKAFTAIEIRHLAERVFREPIRATLERLREAGLGAITGGGAEIFAPEIREQICRGKESAEEWLEVHRTWHELGMRSTATMLFGHIETAAHRVDHLRRLRELQDVTHGFTGFIPFAFEPEGGARGFGAREYAARHCLEELRNLAIARIYLDNFDHITAYWISLGSSASAQAGAQLRCGRPARDDHGREDFFHMGGARRNAAGSDGRRNGTCHTRSGAASRCSATPGIGGIQPPQRAEALACA